MPKGIESSLYDPRTIVLVTLRGVPHNTSRVRKEIRKYNSPEEAEIAREVLLRSLGRPMQGEASYILAGVGRIAERHYSESDL